MTSMGSEAISFPQLPSMQGVGANVGATDTSLGLDQADGVTGPKGPSGDFGDLLVKSLDSVEAMGDKASNLSVQAATGDLNAIHDYTIAATEAQVATQLTVAVRNKAVDAFNEIMRMSV